MNILFLVFIFLGAAADISSSETKPTAMFDKDGNLLPDDPTNPDIHWPKLNNQNGENNKWKGIGQLENGKTKCTVTLIQIPNCPNPKGPPPIKPQVLTNGHCNLRKNPNMTVTFGKFADTNDEKKVKSTSLYHSYDALDFGILELDDNYTTLAAAGIHPIEVATESPRTEHNDTKLETVGIPVQDVPEKDQVLRRGVCTPAGNQKVVNQLQVWSKMTAYTGCSVRGGSSGSGLFHKGKLVGLLNSGAVNSEGLNGPNGCLLDTCIDTNKPALEKQMANFGYDMTSLHKCYKDCKLNTKLAGCPLPDQESRITVDRVLPNQQNHSSNLKANFILSSRFPKYQVKGCMAGPTPCSCNDPSGFKEHTGNKISGAPYFNDGETFAMKPGAPPQIRFLCIRGQNADGSLDSAKNMVEFPLHLYAQAPMSFKPNK